MESAQSAHALQPFRARNLRRRVRRGRVPVGPALPEPDDADPRPRGCFAPLAVGL